MRKRGRGSSTIDVDLVRRRHLFTMKKKKCRISCYWSGPAIHHPSSLLVGVPDIQLSSFFLSYLFQDQSGRQFSGHKLRGMAQLLTLLPQHRAARYNSFLETQHGENSAPKCFRTYIHLVFI